MNVGNQSTMPDALINILQSPLNLSRSSAQSQASQESINAMLEVTSLFPRVLLHRRQFNIY